MFMEIAETETKIAVESSPRTLGEAESRLARGDLEDLSAPQGASPESRSRRFGESGQELLRAHLSREMRRSDRYKVPLSLVQFYVDQAPRMPVRRFLEILSQNKRETDLAASLDSHLVGVLLLSTDRPGAERFAERLASKAADVRFSRAIQTYPHDPIDLSSPDRGVQG